MTAKKAKRSTSSARVPPRPVRRQQPVPRQSVLAGLLESMRRHHRITLAALLGLYLVLAALSFEPQPHTGGDNAAYLTLAHSLIERHAYLDLFDPAEPPHTKYPPVFPLLLAAGLLVGLKPWVGLKLIVVALGGGAIASTFLWIRRRGRPALAFGVALLLACSPGLLREVHWVLSDVPFWCFTALALWAFERLRPGDWRRFALALAATTLAFFTRSAGLPLVVAALAWLAWRRHWRQLAVFILVLGPLAFLWWLRARTLSGGVEYTSEFWLVNPYQPELGRVTIGGLFGRFGDNIAKYVTVHLPVLLRGLPSSPALLAGIVIIPFAIYGWIKRLRRVRVAEFFLPLYLGLILLWPAVWSGERFLLPVFGMLICYAGDGIVRALGRDSHLRRLWVGTGAAVLLLLVALPGLSENITWGTSCTTAYRNGVRYPCLDQPWQEYFDMAEWAGRSLPPDAVVLSRKPRLFYVLSGLQGRNYPMASTAEALLATADSAGAKWVVFDLLGGLAQRYLAPAILQRPAAFCLAQSFGPDATMLFGIQPGADTIPNATSSAPDAGVSFVPCAGLGAPAATAPGGVAPR